MACPGIAWAQSAVRIQVIEEASTARVTVAGPCQIVSLPGKKVLMKLSVLKWQEVRADSSGLRVGEMIFKTRGIQIAPTEAPLIFLNGGRYRGKLNIVRSGRTKFSVISEMGLDWYLKGVVPSEVDYRWPPESLKAQAIIARTFTLLQLNDRAAQDFDVTRKWPQLYGGILAERPTTSRAVDGTRGRVLLYRKQMIPAFYYTVCGGHSEEVSVVWPKVKHPTLKGVECEWCEWHKHYDWDLSLSESQMQRVAKRLNLKIGKIRSFQTSRPNRSGRVETIQIRGEKGTAEISTFDFRMAVGPNQLRSTRFNVGGKSGWWIFAGRGWGHGVGLCQAGAAEQARYGKTTQELLSYYYPASEIGSLD